MNPFSKRSGAFLAALLLCGGALSSAAPGPDPEGEIDKIRAELMRLRAERRALRSELDTGAAAGRRIVSGEVRVESEYAFGTHDAKDLDVAAYIFTEVGDDREDRVTGSFSGWLKWDLDGLGSRGGIVTAKDAAYADYNAIENDRLTQRVYTGYIDVNRLGPVHKVRLGRQFNDSLAGGHFDGASVFFRPGEKTAFHVYGGVPVNEWKDEGESTWSSDRIYGGGLRGRWIEDLSIDVELQGFREHTAFYGTRNDYLGALGLRYRFGENIHASLVENIVSGQQVDLHGTVMYWEDDYDLNVTFDYHWMPERLDDLTYEYTPYTDILGAYEPYQLFQLTLDKGIGEHLEVGADFMIRELVEKTDETPFDMEYTRSRASVTVMDLPIDDLTATAHFEYWDTDEDDVYSLGGDVRKRLGKRHALEAGTYYSKFKYNQFTYDETLNVQTYFMKWRWALSSDMNLQVKGEVEDTDEDTYNSLWVSLSYRF